MIGETMEKTIKNRSEIEKQYKWNLDKMLENEGFDELNQNVLDLAEEIKNMQGTIMDSSNTLLNYLKINDKLEQKLEHIYVYAHLLCDQDTTNVEAQQLKMKVESLSDKIDESLAFVRPEILSVPFDVVLNYISI